MAGIPSRTPCIGSPMHSRALATLGLRGVRAPLVTDAAACMIGDG